jgi:hypothetical protein
MFDWHTLAEILATRRRRGSLTKSLLQRLVLSDLDEASEREHARRGVAGAS